MLKHRVNRKSQATSSEVFHVMVRSQTHLSSFRGGLPSHSWSLRKDVSRKSSMQRSISEPLDNIGLVEESGRFSTSLERDVLPDNG